MMIDSKLALGMKRKSTYPSEEITCLIENLISDYQSELLHLAMSYLNDYQLAQDCIQEIFITAYRKVDPGEDRTVIRKWLKVCTINRCKSMLRTSFWRRMAYWEHDRLASVAAARCDNYARLDETGVLEQVMKLSIKYREVIILYYYQDMPLHEISEVLHISQEAAKTRLRRAKGQLRELMKGDETDEQLDG